VALAARNAIRRRWRNWCCRRHPKYVQSADWTHAMPLAVLEQFAAQSRAGLCRQLDRFLSLAKWRGEDEVYCAVTDEMFRHGEHPAALHEGLRLLRRRTGHVPPFAIAGTTLGADGERAVPRGGVLPESRNPSCQAAAVVLRDENFIA